MIGRMKDKWLLGNWKVGFEVRGRRWELKKVWEGGMEELVEESNRMEIVGRWDGSDGRMRWKRWEDGMEVMGGWDGSDGSMGWKRWEDGMEEVGGWDGRGGRMGWKRWEDGMEVVGGWDGGSGRMGWR